jgi:hypothetical protein
MNRFYLEQLKLGELSPEREILLKKETGWEKELAGLEASDAEILSRYPAGSFAASLTERQNRKPSGSRIIPFPVQKKHWLPLMSVAAALALFAVSIPLIVSKTQGMKELSPEFEQTRIKGIGKPDTPAEPVIHIYRNAGNAAEEMTDGAPASAGDRIQISYFAPAKTWGAIFSLDGNNTLTMHLPERGSEMTALEPGKEIYLPWAYELDNAPLYETFLLVYANRPLSVSVLSEVIRSAQNPDKIEEKLISLYGKKAGVGVYSVRITKR